LYLSPDLALPTSLAPPVAESLATALRRIEEDDDTTAGVPGSGAPAFTHRSGQIRTEELGLALPGRPVGGCSATPSLGDRDALPDRFSYLESAF